MSLIDVILAFPALILLLALVSIFEVRSLTLISLVIGVLSIPAYTRVSRANSLAISNREFVTAARAIGTSPSKILFREVIPNVLPTLLSYAMVAAAFVIVVEGSLSFLGLSVQLPQSTWGNMINQARRDIRVDIWQVVWPSLALTLTVLSLNQVGDWFQQRSAVVVVVQDHTGLPMATLEVVIPAQRVPMESHNQAKHHAFDVRRFAGLHIHDLADLRAFVVAIETLLGPVLPPVVPTAAWHELCDQAGVRCSGFQSDLIG